MPRRCQRRERTSARDIQRRGRGEREREKRKGKEGKRGRCVSATDLIPITLLPFVALPSSLPLHSSLAIVTALCASHARLCTAFHLPRGFAVSPVSFFASPFAMPFLLCCFSPSLSLSLSRPCACHLSFPRLLCRWRLSMRISRRRATGLVAGVFPFFLSISISLPPPSPRLLLPCACPLLRHGRRGSTLSAACSIAWRCARRAVQPMRLCTPFCLIFWPSVFSPPCPLPSSLQACAAP